MGRVWGWILPLVLLSSFARAEDLSALSDQERTRRARELFERGREHVDHRDYEAATREFEQAYVLKPLPLLLFNLGQLAYVQNQRARALQLYEEFVRDAPNTHETAQAQQRISELKRSLAEKPEPPPAAPPSESPPPPSPTPSSMPAHETPRLDVVVTPTPQAQATAAAARPLALTATPPPPSHRKRWIALGVAGGALAVGAVVLAIVLTLPRSPPSGTLGAPVDLVPR